jgi:hypothetical protein
MVRNLMVAERPSQDVGRAPRVPVSWKAPGLGWRYGTARPAPRGRQAARSHSSAINWLIARQEVAAGDGAFRTCMS